MSKLIATRAIRGAHKLVARAEKSLEEALKNHGPDKKVEFPNTGYYLPVIYSLTGMKVETLEDLKKPMEFARGL
ncbi:MAG: CO dehydrogenase/CO-methylating acetyl-CoA synthase complex subunit beta, partial [Planctomycetes bacterium]|nr:CO dehydrogenase/CO-methylating acetyl-CoA synthase complex subunit beta [Planctomycetota bacterium]